MGADDLKFTFRMLTRRQVGSAVPEVLAPRGTDATASRILLGDPEIFTENLLQRLEQARLTTCKGDHRRIAVTQNVSTIAETTKPLSPMTLSAWTDVTVDALIAKYAEQVEAAVLHLTGEHPQIVAILVPRDSGFHALRAFHPNHREKAASTPRRFTLARALKETTASARSSSETVIEITLPPAPETAGVDTAADQTAEAALTEIPSNEPSLGGTVLGGTVLGGTVLGGTVLGGTVLGETVLGRVDWPILDTSRPSTSTVTPPGVWASRTTAHASMGIGVSHSSKPLPDRLDQPIRGRDTLASYDCSTALVCQKRRCRVTSVSIDRALISGTVRNHRQRIPQQSRQARLFGNILDVEGGCARGPPCKRVEAYAALPRPLAFGCGSSLRSPSRPRPMDFARAERWAA
jgi:hypothetical protein